jgi:hypothetical protein
MNTIGSYIRRIFFGVGLSVCLSLPGICQEADTTPESKLSFAAEEVRIHQGTLLQIELTRRTDWKHLRRDSVVDGRLTLPVFVGNDVSIPKDTKVSLTVESVKKVGANSGAWKKAGHAVVRAFNPMQKSQPTEFAIQVSKTEIESPEGGLDVAATAVRAGYATMIEPKLGKGGQVDSLQSQNPKSAGFKRGRQTVILRLEEDLLYPAAAAARKDVADHSRGKVHAFLLTQLSASRSRKGDVFQARLAEPVQFGDEFFEEGSIVNGSVSQRVGPRMLSRAGSLHLRINGITSPLEVSKEIAGSLAGVESEPGAKYALDEEGGLRGLKPGFANAAVDLAIAYSIGKVTDDLAETPIRAIGAAMSDAAVANAARYFGLGASAFFLATRHGRDVYLPRYTEIEIDFGRLAEQTTDSARSQH